MSRSVVGETMTTMSDRPTTRDAMALWCWFVVLLVALSSLGCDVLAQQRRGYEREDGDRDRTWVFCTLKFKKVRHQPAGSGFMTDFRGPAATSASACSS